MGARCESFESSVILCFSVCTFQPTHKMQSGQGAPTISLQLVPKMLAPLVRLWVPNAFVVSFKLETDEGLLIAKARDSLNKYKHRVNNNTHSSPTLHSLITFVHATSHSSSSPICCNRARIVSYL